jgi:hypothetical protein
MSRGWTCLIRNVLFCKEMEDGDMAMGWGPGGSVWVGNAGFTGAVST